MARRTTEPRLPFDLFALASWAAIFAAYDGLGPFGWIGVGFAIRGLLERWARRT